MHNEKLRLNLSLTSQIGLRRQPAAATPFALAAATFWPGVN